MKCKYLNSLHILVILAGVLAFAGCASIGRPQGGAKDELPPVFVSSNPAPGARNVKKERIDIFFNENVQLQDAFNKVIVSPVQTTAPQIQSNGKHVTVTLRDTLVPNATYTIDFGDAIKDLNEGNILDGFSTWFSTGDSIDTLRISGMVLEARTLEPAQGMLVGIHSNLSDTAITKLKFDRVSRTNQLGQFTIYNLKPGEYRVFALNDVNRDYKWDRTEDVAFYDVTVSPTVQEIEVVDTLRSSAGTDSLRSRQGTAYLPNDILLSWFNEGYKAQYLKDYARPERKKITINMNAPSDTMPQITIASGRFEGKPIDEWALAMKNPTLDSLQYFITDTAVLHTDSLYLSVKYLRTDTTDMLTWKDDTLKFFFKDPKKKEKKKKDKEEADTLPPPINFITVSPVTPASHDVYMPLKFKVSDPIDTIIEEGVHFEHLIDTVWHPITDAVMEIDSLSPLMQRVINYKWNPGDKYRLSIDSASVYSVYGEWNNKMKHEFTVKPLEEYSNLIMNIYGTDSAAVVELLDKSDKEVATAPVVNGKAELKYLKPGQYYVRLFIDKNRNGKWDTGKLLEQIQPEEVYYFTKKLNLRKNWDVTQDWDINEVAVDLQKPYEIKKNKPKLKQGEQAPVNPEDEEEEDEFGGYNNTNYGRSQNGNQTGKGGSNMPFGGLGGFGRR